MALIYFDSFDTYQSADITKRWTDSSGGPTIEAGLGRTSQALNLDVSDSVYIGVPSADTYVVGFAWKATTLPTTYSKILAFANTADQYYLAVTSTGAIQARIGTSNAQTAGGAAFSTQKGTTAGGVVQADTWYYLECRCKVSNTVGEFEARVNGVTVLDTDDLSDQDTSYNATTITAIGLGYNVAESYIDDFYICDTSGSVNNTFLGDVTITALLPEGNGTNSDFVGSDADSTDNYLLVDDSAPDGDTTFVQSATIGAYDTYVYPPLATTVSAVLGVQIAPCAPKTDTGTRTYTTVVKLSGGSETDGAVTQAPSFGSYAYGIEMWEEKPGTGAWSVSDVDNAEFGLKVSG